jgi:hypothetical protein
MVPRLLVAAFLSAAALPALADDVPLPDLTPKGQYLVMTQDDATSTSKCIGDPKTPLCAVETVRACYIRGKADLCRIGTGVEGYDQVNGIKLDNEIYRVKRAEVLSDRRFPWNPKQDPRRNGDINMQAGDIRIDIADKWCSKEIPPDGCGRNWMFPTAYIVRKVRDHWSVTVWGPAFDPRGLEYR